MWPCSDIPSVSNVLILEGSYNKLLDGQKVISMFYKLDIEEPERVLNKLSRGQGGNINKKYFTTWVFSEHKVRATETVLPTTSIPSNRNSNTTDVASKSNPTIDIKTNTDTNTSSQKQQQASKLRTLELTKNTEALKTYGMAALNKVGQSFGESKIRALCQKLSTDPSNNDSLLKRDLFIQFIGQLKLKQPELVVNALCNGTSEGDISKQLFLSWCGFESKRQLSQSDQHLLAYGKSALQKLGASFGHAKVLALCRKMECNDTHLNRNKVIHFLEQVSLRHSTYVLSALSGKTEGAIPKDDFMNWCGMENGREDIDPYTPLSMMDFTDV